MSEQEQNATAEAPEATATPSEVETLEVADPAVADEFDAARALDKIRKVNAEAKALREKAKAAEDAKTTAEDRAKAAEELAAKVPDLEAQLVRERVARRLALPDALVDRLRGATEEEVMADAEALVALVAAPKAPKAARPVESLQPGSGKAEAAHSLDQQIAAAQASGDWRTALSLQNQKLLNLPTPT